MGSIKTTHTDGDMSVGRNVAIGGKAQIAGSATIGHNLEVKGWLDAPNIKGTNKGVYLTLEELREAYPAPRDGWFAGVGASTPFATYIGKNKDWVATGGTIDVTVNMTTYIDRVESVNNFSSSEIPEDTERQVHVVGAQAYQKDMYVNLEFNNWRNGRSTIAANFPKVGEMGNFLIRPEYAGVWQTIEVKEGEVYRLDNIKSPYGSYKYVWVIYDKNMKCVAVCDKTEYNDYPLVIPAGGAILCVQSLATTNPKITRITKKTDIDNSDWIDVPLQYFKDGQSFKSYDVGKVFGFAFDAWSSSCFVVDCEVGDVFKLANVKGSGSYEYAVLDAQNIVLECVPYGIQSHGYKTFSIPEGGCMLVINSTSGALSNKVISLKRRKRDTDDIVLNNHHKDNILYAMSARTILSEGLPTKRLTFGWVSDTHGDEERYSRFVDYVNAHKDVIDAVINTGDMNTMADNDNGFVNTILKYPVNMPMIPVIGNHDATGQTNGTGQQMASGSQMWNGTKYILPFADSTVVMGADNCYYYRDFTAQKIRVIGINDYDRPRYIGGKQWKTTTDPVEISSAEAWVSGKEYAPNAVVLYKGLYVKNSGTTSIILADDGVSYREDRAPISLYDCNCRHLGQEQINFIINAMNVEQGWSIIFVSHVVLDAITPENIVDDNFTSRTAVATKYSSTKYGQNGYIMQDIISAYLNRGTLNETYKAITPNLNPLAGTLSNVPDIMPDVTAVADFTSAKGDVICWLAGHSHQDATFKSSFIKDGKKLLILNMTTSCYKSPMSNQRWFCGDLVKGGHFSRDAFNVISFDTTEKAVYLMRVGVDINDQFKERKFTRINYEHN